MNATPLLTPERIDILRAALRSHLKHREALVCWLHVNLQGHTLAKALIAAQDEIRDARTLLDELDDKHRRLTGLPIIAHGNTDLHDPANEPMSPDDFRHGTAHG